MYSIPSWEALRQAIEHWVKEFLLPALKVHLKLGLLGVLNGVLDVFLLFGLTTSLVVGSNVYMERQYSLPRTAQYQILTWADSSDRIAREADIPSVTPLVLWYKEASLESANPGNCEGIMGVHDLVTSGRQPCFAPGPINTYEIIEQLRIGAREFKVRCPQVRYATNASELIKHCYLFYNAGASARMDPDRSGYVMNQYDEAHQNMLHQDAEGRAYRLQNVGAWPAHLAMESLILSQRDKPGEVRIRLSAIELALQPALDMLTRWRDWVANWRPTSVSTDLTNAPAWRPPRSVDCIIKPHSAGSLNLRPALNPVLTAPVLTQDLHGCGYGLPGLDIGSSKDASSPLQAPISGRLMTYTDQWRNTTIRIENDEWIVTLLHPRSYLVRQGLVSRGQRVGVMGAQGQATGPHVHYSIYDKLNKGYIDPGAFIPFLAIQ